MIRSRTCKKLVEKERGNLPEGVEILYSNDSSRVVRNSFHTVLSNGLMGLALVLILLAIFLNLRAAFWVAMGIPVALLGTIFMLPLFDVYLDTITLTAIILVIGIIVDDAIIISENIYSRREKGDQPLEAAVTGIHEVFRPVVTTVLTTFIVFVPMFFMPGIFGKFITVIPLAISLALFISLAEAMVALPAHLVPGLRRRSEKSSRVNRRMNVSVSSLMESRRKVVTPMAIERMICPQYTSAPAKTTIMAATSVVKPISPRQALTK